jgi:hypothetical protein
MMRHTKTLHTLRVDMAAREGAEILANELPNNRSLLHLTVGGPVDPQLLSRMSDTLLANTMRQSSAPPPGECSSPTNCSIRYPITSIYRIPYIIYSKKRQVFFTAKKRELLMLQLRVLYSLLQVAICVI